MATKSRKFKNGDRVRPTEAAVREIPWSVVRNGKPLHGVVMPRNGKVRADQIDVRLDGYVSPTRFSDRWWEFETPAPDPKEGRDAK